MSDSIPSYPASRPVEISDATLLREHFHMLQPKISEFSFANLYLFRHAHSYAITRVKSSLIILGCSYDGIPYFLPPLSGDRGETARKLLNEGNILYGADEAFVAEHLAGRGYAVVPDTDNDDYIYMTSDLAELPGKRFHKKKNRISYFASRHDYSVETYSQTHLESSLQLMDTWERVHREEGNPSLTAEAAATREGLALASELGLYGVVLLTIKGVSAFALGEQLNDSTFVCHFEKADPFLNGAAQLVNREFTRTLPSSSSLVNREQDLGDAGLRQAKSSYYPVEMVKKFKISCSG